MRPAIWTTIAAAAASISLALGMRQTFGLFLLPLSAEAGISPAVLGTAVAIHNLVWGLSQPITGALADRDGAGRVMATGALLLAAGVGLPALWTSAPAIFIGIGILTGMGVSCCGTGAALAAVGRAVPPERRGEMIGLASAGGSLGQAAMVPLAQSLIGGVGAIATLGILALSLLVILPISRAIEWQAPRQTPGRQATGLAGLPDLARMALADRDFALLTAGFFACGFQLAFLTMHLPSHLTICGLPVGLGAMALMTVGLFNIPGSWLCGRVSNFMQPERALGSSTLCGRVAIACFAFTTPSYAGTIVFAAVMGFVWLGTHPADQRGDLAALRRRRSRRTLRRLLPQPPARRLPRRRGRARCCWSMAGSYQAFWPVMIAVGIAASVMNWMVRPPRGRWPRAACA